MPPAIATPETQSKRQGPPTSEHQYNLVIFDDDEHSYAYVIEMMVNLFGMSQQEGFDIAYLVDHNGEAIVKTCGFEEAVIGKEKIQGYGPDSRSEGSKSSMRAEVFRADQ